jgi:hypothetical protein
MTTCPQEAKIDPYLKGKLSEAESAAFEEHYFNCPSCFQKTYARNELVDVIQHRGVSIFAPDYEIRRASPSKAPVWDKVAATLSPRPWAVAVAAAAVLVAVIVGVAPRSSPALPGFTAVDDMTVRGSSVEAIAPAGSLEQAPALLAWKAVSGAAEYTVSLFRGSNLLWTANASDVRIPLPETLRSELTPGTGYAWQVKAYSVQGTLISSSPRTEFTIVR